MNSIEYVGLTAGMLTTISFLPQLIKVLRSRSARDISIAAYIVFLAGIGLWLTYGVLIDSTAIIVANSCTFLIAGGILFCKIRFG